MLIIGLRKVSYGLQELTLFFLQIPDKYFKPNLLDVMIDTNLQLLIYIDSLQN